MQEVPTGEDFKHFRTVTDMPWTSWSRGKSDSGSGVVHGSFSYSTHCVLGCCQLDSSILAFMGGPISEQTASSLQQTVNLGRKTVDRKPETVGMAKAGKRAGPHREMPSHSHKRKVFSLTDHNQMVRRLWKLPVFFFFFFFCSSV